MTRERVIPPGSTWRCDAVASSVAAVLGKAPRISRWTFSTNGVASMGRHGIPTVGFAPGLEELSHTTGEWVAEDDLVKATAVYSLIPEMLAELADELLGVTHHPTGGD